MRFNSTVLTAAFLTGMIAFWAAEAKAQHLPDDFYFPTGEISGNVFQSEEVTFWLETVVDGLSDAWALAFLPDGRVLITEKGGSLRIVENGQLSPQVIGGTPTVFNRNQGGLLDVALHPDFINNQLVYLAYSYSQAGTSNTAIGRGRLEGYMLHDFEEIFRGHPNTSRPFHFGSRIVFDADGFLYFAIGDRGVMENAQLVTNHAGKSMRIHDDGRAPRDNPFVNVDGGMPEIFTLGNRNIQGMVVHPVTGEVWSHEHGARGGDEINILRRGRNYGWPVITHGVDYDGSPISQDTAAVGMEQPLHHWTPSIAPSGMAIVHNSARYPGWNGNVFSGALAGRHLNRIVVDLENERAVHQERLVPGLARIRDVRFAPDGFLYIIDESNGRVLRLVPIQR